MTTAQRPSSSFSRARLGRICPWLAGLAIVVAVARCWANVGLYNHTTDELAHIAGAVGFYETGRSLYMVEHPPVQRIVVGAAPKLAGVAYPPAREADGVRARPEANEVGEAITMRGPRGYWETLAVARRANLLFLAVLLAYFYVLGRYLAGPVAGMLACAFLSVDPTLLGHAGLVTTDVPAAAGFVAATYYAIRFVARPGWGRAIVAGVVLGLAVGTKFTCGLLVPAVIVFMAIRWVAKRRRGRRTGGTPVMRGIGHFAAIAGIAMLTLWATYLFNVGRLEDQHLFGDDVKGWAKIPERVKDATIPMPSMPLGVMFMAAIGKTGFPCYFNGQLDFSGHLLYFPEAIAIKSPAALGAGVGLAIVACVVAKRRRWLLGLCVALPPSLLLLTAMTGRLQIGIRHVLPVIPFIYLGVVMALSRGRWVVALVPLIVVAAAETGSVRGEWLPFFNRAAGGAANGSKYLADSNLDWGQDVARLATYLKGRGATDYTIKVSGVRVAALVAHLGLDPASREVKVDELKARPHGLLALGVNARLGLEEFKRDADGKVTHGPDYSWVSAYPVVARIGESIEVYDLDARR